MRQGAGQEHFGWARNISPAIVSDHLDMRPKAASQSSCSRTELIRSNNQKKVFKHQQKTQHQQKIWQNMTAQKPTL